MDPFELTVETAPQAGEVRLRLADGAGRHPGASQVRLAEHSTWFWEGLFDTREHVDRYAGAVRVGGAEWPATAAELLGEIGVFLGRTVLGPEILAPLWKGLAHRSLVVRLPGTEGDPLTAAFARVPWEIARPRPGDEPLMARNLVVRAVAAGVENGGEAPLPGPGEPLRRLRTSAGMTHHLPTWNLVSATVSTETVRMSQDPALPAGGLGWKVATPRWEDETPHVSLQTRRQKLRPLCWEFFQPSPPRARAAGQ